MIKEFAIKHPIIFCLLSSILIFLIISSNLKVTGEISNVCYDSYYVDVFNQPWIIFVFVSMVSVVVILTLILLKIGDDKK